MELHAAVSLVFSTYPPSLIHFPHLKVVREVDQKEVVILSACHQVGEICRGDGDAGRSELGEKLL